MRRTTPTTDPAPRVIHHVVPAAPAELVYRTPRQAAAKRAEQQMLYARWKARQLAIAEHDRKVRRFWLGFGAVFALALVAALGVAGWAIWQFVTSIGLGLIAFPLVVVGIGALLFGGHRCITVVQHWH